MLNMIRILRLLKIIFLFVIFFSESRAEDVIETGIDGLVLKKFSCKYDNYSGNIVNRSDNLIKVIIKVKSYDSDNDPIGQCSSFGKVLGPKSGDSILLQGCNCYGAKSFSVSTSTW